MKKTLASITAFFDKNEGLIENYALIGGLAIGGWVAPRATRDIDFFISLRKDEPPAREEMVRRLRSSGFEGKLYQGDMGDNIRACIKTIFTERNIPLDLLIVTRKWELEIVKASRVVEIFSAVSIPIVPAEGLIVLKLRAAGMQDIADASKLLTGKEDLNTEMLLKLARRARVDKNLHRLAERLRIDL